MDNVTFNEEQRAELHAVEAQIKRRVAIGAHVSERRLVDELVRAASWSRTPGMLPHAAQGRQALHDRPCRLRASCSDCTPTNGSTAQQFAADLHQLLRKSWHAGWLFDRP